MYRSQDWKCEHCGYVRSLVRPVTEASQALSKEAKELGSQINLQASIFLLALCFAFNRHILAVIEV